MWRNPVICELVEWLRDHGVGAGFYGLDLSSLRESTAAVGEHLQRLDPDAAGRARRRYACFDHLDEQSYGDLTASGDQESCEDAIVEVLQELYDRAADLASRDPHLPRDAHFFAEQNARLAVSAERYDRAMFRGRASTWNMRDTHMADTLDALRRHLGGDLGERMIGVVYRPGTERQSHDVEAVPAEQFDLVVHTDETTALEPLTVPSR